MMRRAARLVLAATAVAAAAACGPNYLDAAFTSRIVQHETCKVVGDRPQVCSKAEATTDVRVRLVERDDQNVWLYGIPRNGVSDRALLGSRDDEGGFLFVDETVQSNDASNCTLEDRFEISLKIDPDANADDIGVNACVALLGRENETTASSAGCDAVNIPPVATTLVANRRWDKPLDCSP